MDKPLYSLFTTFSTIIVRVVAAYKQRCKDARTVSMCNQMVAVSVGVCYGVCLCVGEVSCVWCSCFKI